MSLAKSIPLHDRLKNGAIPGFSRQKHLLFGVSEAHFIRLSYHLEGTLLANALTIRDVTSGRPTFR